MKEKAICFENSVFDDLARTRTTLEVLPNLRRLCWDTSDSHWKSCHAIPFMHDKITEFAFYPDYNDPVLLTTDIVARMPSLTSLTCISFGRHDPSKHQQLLKLLSEWRKLQAVTLPKNFLDDRFLKTLSLLPELRVIQFDTLGGLPGLTTPTIKSTLEDGAFPMLYDLCLHSTLDDMRHYLTGGALLPQLKNLSVESVHPEPAQTVQQFFVEVTRCYPGLETVSVDVIVSIRRQDSCQPLMLEDFCPLLSLHQLVRLELRHNLPLQISDIDLTELGAALPSIESLVLNPEPLLLTKPRFTIRSLLSVAQNFPNLLHLGLYLDAQEDMTPPVPSVPGTRMFPYLRTLNVGVSAIGPDHIPVALFLSHLLSENERVVIQSGVSWNKELFRGFRSSGYSAAVQTRCDRWNEVVKTLPLLWQLRREEKAHRQDIEKEVEDLRMRNEVLMGKMQVNGDAKSGRVIDNKCMIC